MRKNLLLNSIVKASIKSNKHDVSSKNHKEAVIVDFLKNEHITKFNEPCERIFDGKIWKVEKTLYHQSFEFKGVKFSIMLLDEKAMIDSEQDYFLETIQQTQETCLLLDLMPAYYMDGIYIKCEEKVFVQGGDDNAIINDAKIIIKELKELLNTQCSAINVEFEFEPKFKEDTNYNGGKIKFDQIETQFNKLVNLNNKTRLCITQIYDGL